MSYNPYYYQNMPYWSMQEGASVRQIGQAAQFRGNYPLTFEERRFCNQIVHSGDTIGPFATTPNSYRDPTFTYDARAQRELNKIQMKYT